MTERYFAVLEIPAVREDGTATMKLTIVLAVSARAPIAHVTVPPDSVQSPEDTKDRPAGTVSVTVEPVESDGPLLVTVSV